MKHIYNIHHYLGTLFFVLFIVWFLSGIVMMYKSFPFLSGKERMATTQVLAVDSSYQHPKVIFPEVKDESISRFRVNKIGGQLAYHLETSAGKTISRYEDSGLPIELNMELASRIAQQATSISQKGDIAVIQEVDQWIPRSQYFKHLPVWKVQFSDEEKTLVHISSLTGEVLNITMASDRFWAWLGAIPHWIYFKDIRVHGELWSQLVIWLSGFGLIMTISGIVTGLSRSRKKPKARFRRFKNKWYNIHYYTGLGFGLFVCTWIFSGLMSMTPLDWVARATLSPDEKSTWQGKELTIDGITNQEWDNYVNAFSTEAPRELSLSVFDRFIFLDAYSTDKVETFCLTTPSYQPSLDDYRDKINQSAASSPVESIAVLESYDNYYYHRKGLRPLPVVKATTTTGTSYYIDPVRSQVLKKVGTKNRWNRWLYHGLHSLDFSFLTSNRPLWDIVMIFLLAGGTAVCITAAGLGVKFVRRKVKKYKKRADLRKG